MSQKGVEKNVYIYKEFSWELRASQPPSLFTIPTFLSLSIFHLGATKERFHLRMRLL